MPFCGAIPTSSVLKVTTFKCYPAKKTLDTYSVASFNTIDQWFFEKRNNLIREFWHQSNPRLVKTRNPKAR
jgi:hypothetical protein